MEKFKLDCDLPITKELMENNFYANFRDQTKPIIIKSNNVHILYILFFNKIFEIVNM